MMIEPESFTTIAAFQELARTPSKYRGVTFKLHPTPRGYHFLHLWKMYCEFFKIDISAYRKPQTSFPFGIHF